MLSKFDPNSLQNQLSEIVPIKQLAFGAICCERLIQNYEAFVIDSNWGDVSPVRAALDFVWKSIETEEYDNESIQKYLSECEEVIPDSDKFESLYVSFAQDASLAVCCLLDFLLKNDTQRIVQVGVYATDSVDLYVQEIEELKPSASDLEERILEHKLMQRELSEQKENLSIINNKGLPLKSDFLLELVKRWMNLNGGKSNLDLPKDR